VSKKKPVRKTKHIPQRTCVGCRQVLEKRSLVRIVRAADGILVDPTGKMAGRGAYLHNKLSCWVTAMKGELAKALKTELNENDKKILSEFMTGLTDEERDL